MIEIQSFSQERFSRMLKLDRRKSMCFFFHLDLITSAIESYRTDDQRLKLAALRLFHGLSRSVDQLHTTFNEQICDILLDALKSNDLSLVKTSSCAISNLILEFSTCRKVFTKTNTIKFCFIDR